MKKFFLVLAILICLGVYALSDIISVELNNSGNQINLIESSTDYCRIEYTVGTFQKETITIDGEQYNLLSLAGEPTLLLKGMPDLPKITRSITISENAEMSINILESEYTELEMKVGPSKGSILRVIDPDTVPYEFSDVYSMDEFYPASIADLGTSYIFRDLRGITITLCPVTYNPVQDIVRVYTRVLLEIVNTGPAENIRSGDKEIKKPDKTFKEIYNNHFLNFQSYRYPAMDENGSMLIICADSFMSEMQPFVDWKNQKGISTTMAGINSIGNNADQIKTYINNQYTQGNLTFVLLVGDGPQITAYTVNDFMGGRAYSDASYSLLDGNDNYPEIIVGRFSAENTNQVRIQVNKTIFHERDLGDEAWRYKAIGYGSAEGPGDDNELDYQHIRNIRTDLLNYRYTHVDEFYEGSQGGEDASGDPTVSMGQNALNEGRGLINYAGHGDYSGWMTGWLNISAVNNLNNTNKMPLIFSVGCVVGGFSNQTCFSEAWLRAGSDSNFTGAVGMYGSSIMQAWAEPMRAQDEFVDLLVAETRVSFGALCYMGSSKMIDEGGEGAETFLGWILFGDPSLQVRSTGTTPTPTPITETPAPTPDANRLGDTNNDNNIDIIDALLTAQFYVGLNPANFIEANADTNCDGHVDIIDALLIAQYYVGLITGFCL